VKYYSFSQRGKSSSLLYCANGSYENHEVALNCGTCLREAFKHEQLAKIVLYSPVFWSFFDYVETGVFDVAGDAFSTFKVLHLLSHETYTKELLVRHKQLTADFLTENYNPVLPLAFIHADIPPSFSKSTMPSSIHQITLQSDNL